MWSRDQSPRGAAISSQGLTPRFLRLDLKWVKQKKVSLGAIVVLGRPNDRCPSARLGMYRGLHPWVSFPSSPERVGLWTDPSSIDIHPFISDLIHIQSSCWCAKLATAPRELRVFYI